MERSDVVSGKDCCGKGGSSDGFIDRSKVKILVCDSDAKSSAEVFSLLCRCSYQVISVRSPRQVIDALNAEGLEIDIILSEVDLPMSKGLKLLKYIMKDKDLRRIPVIMMSAQDEVSIVVKCLKFGAADYLVKPLRTNELLNLWTHVWRRRRMLGLAEKNILNYDFDVIASDPSDANTNSTTLFSDDTDDKSRKSANLDVSVSTQHDDEINVVTGAAPAEAVHVDSVDCRPDVPGISDRRRGQILSCPKKSELRIGESSAFFTYVKSNVLKSNVHGVSHVEENEPHQLRSENRCDTSGAQVVIETGRHVVREALEYHVQRDDVPGNYSTPNSYSIERSCTLPLTMQSMHHENPEADEHSQTQGHMHPQKEPHLDVSAPHAHAAYPYYISGMVNQVMMPSSAPPVYQKNLPDLQSHATTSMMHHYNQMPQCPSQLPAMPSFPYYPFSICMPPRQMLTAQAWPSYGSSSSAEGKLNKVDRREAALMKFRQKRKERCFDKKIRYVNRKRLAERRPRVRGQFVRKVNGVNVDLNGQPASGDEDEEEDEDEDYEGTNRDLSPEDDVSVQ